MPDYQIKHDVLKKQSYIKRHRGGEGLKAGLGEITFIVEARDKQEATIKARIKVNEILSEIIKKNKQHAEPKKN